MLKTENSNIWNDSCYLIYIYADVAGNSCNPARQQPVLVYFLCMSFDKCRSARANSSEVLEHLLFDLEGINFPKVSVLKSNIVTFKCFTLKIYTYQLFYHF